MTDPTPDLHDEPGLPEAAVRTYPYEENETIVLGPGIFASADRSVLNWEGQNYVPQKAVSEEPTPLKSYESGQYVTVLKNGDWLEGRVSHRDKVSNHVHVDTDRGPVTVASNKYIKRVSGK